LATLAAPGISATARSRSDVTDHDLVQAVRAGDDHAFERLYHRYHRRISAYIFGMVHDHGRAEDLTQEVFVSALRRMRQTDRPITFKPWIYEIAKNACIDAFRRSKRAEEVSIDADEGLAPADHGKLASNSPSPDAAVEGKQQLDDLCGAFGGLSDAHHQILVMRELEGLSYREIGERLDMSRPSVESTLFRARRRLTEEYEDLRTGARCLRIQEIIERATATAATLGTRDQRRVGSHISHCQPCRKHAVMAGMDAAALGRRTVRAKLAAFLPLPAVLRKRWFGGDGAGGDVAAAQAAHHGPALAQMSMAAAQYGEPSMAGWMKATAVVTAVAIAGLGAGAADHAVKGAAKPNDAPAAAHAAPVSTAKAPAAGGSAAGGARQTIARSTGATSAGHGSKGSRQSGAGGSSGASGFSTASGGGAAAPSTNGAGAPSSPNGGGKGESASSASTGGGSATSTASKPAGGGAASSPVQQAAGAVSGTAETVTETVAGATGGGGSTAPLVDPDLGALTQPSSNPPPETAGQVVSGTTDVVGNTVGGQAGEAVKQTGAAVGSTVDHVTQGVTGAVGGLLGGK
jgi:RNA polymerase sigma factor (sigma-70 family)